MNTGQSAVCIRSLGFQFFRITTLTPSQLKTNLEFQSVGSWTDQLVWTRRLKYRVRRKLGVLSIQPKINRDNTQLLQNSRNFAKKLNETDHFGSVKPEYLGPPTGQTIILYPFANFNLANCCPQYHSSVMILSTITIWRMFVNLCTNPPFVSIEQQT